MVSVFGERWHRILNSCCKILFLQFQLAVLLGSVEGAEGWLLVLLNPALPNPHTCTLGKAFKLDKLFIGKAFKPDKLFNGLACKILYWNAFVVSLFWDYPGLKSWMEILSIQCNLKLDIFRWGCIILNCAKFSSDTVGAIFILTNCFQVQVIGKGPK